MHGEEISGLLKELIDFHSAVYSSTEPEAERSRGLAFRITKGIRIERNIRSHKERLGRLHKAYEEAGVVPEKQILLAGLGYLHDGAVAGDTTQVDRVRSSFVVTPGTSHRGIATEALKRYRQEVLTAAVYSDALRTLTEQDEPTLNDLLSGTFRRLYVGSVEDLVPNDYLGPVMFSILVTSALSACELNRIALDPSTVKPLPSIEPPGLD